LSSIKSKTSNKIKFLKAGIFVFPLVFIFLIFWHKILYGARTKSYVHFIREDGPVEYSTAVFYFLAFILSVIIFVKLFKQKKKFFAALYLLLAVGFLFIAFEEINWGQSIFQLETPEYFEDNIQDEISLHNLPMFANYKKLSIFLVGFVGFILWVVFTHFDKLKNKPFTKLFVPKSFTMSYFISVVIAYGIIFSRPYFKPIFGKEAWFKLFTWRDLEIFEFLLSAGIFIFVASVIIELKNQKKNGEP